MTVVLKDTIKAHVVPSVSIRTLTFNNDDELTLEPTDKVILVGANNSGKSRTIREIVRICEEGANYKDRLTLQDLTLTKVGTQEEFRAYVERTGKLRDNAYLMGDWAVSVYQMNEWAQTHLGGISAGYVRNLDATSRLAICNLQENIASGELANRPQQLLHRDSGLMARVSGLFYKAFGAHLMIDYLGGSKIPLYMGKVPEGIADRASTEYATAVNTQPALHEQSDGIKSYAGILFEVIGSPRDITCIDEPEAFLHPPQMRRLGETLAEHVPGQLIVATHSSDILRGFLEGRKGKVRILRIQREDQINRIFEASPADIEALWTTPVLRFSNALEAIFHDQAILCEDDSDCRLFSSMADHLQTHHGENWPDTAYVPMGGKAGIPRAANVLRAVGVPVKAVFDFDLIGDKGIFRKAIEAFGGQWSEFEARWSQVEKAVLQITPPSAQQIKDQVRALLDGVEAEVLPRQKVDELFRSRSAWADIKRYGIEGIPKGDARKECEMIVKQLAVLGIYLVPKGEIESFCPAVGGHGPRFVSRVLAEIPLDDEQLHELRVFTRKVHQGPASQALSVGKPKSVGADPADAAADPSLFGLSDPGVPL